MNGIGKAIILGTCGNDPTIAYTAKGTPVMNLSLAVNKRVGDDKERTSWFKVVVFGKYAEALHPMIKKGSKLYVEGDLEQKSWQDKNGNKRETTEINAIDVQLIASSIDRIIDDTWEKS